MIVTQDKFYELQYNSKNFGDTAKGILYFHTDCPAFFSLGQHCMGETLAGELTDTQQNLVTQDHV